MGQEDALKLCEDVLGLVRRLPVHSIEIDPEIEFRVENVKELINKKGIATQGQVQLLKGIRTDLSNKIAERASHHA